MNVVDSSAWLSYFAGEKNAAVFSKAIEEIDKLLVPSITLTEVFKIILLQRNEELALATVAHMQQGRVVSLDSELAVDAAGFGVMHKLPLADSIIFATAHRYNATIWTQDSDFEGLTKVRYYARFK